MKTLLLFILSQCLGLGWVLAHATPESELTFRPTENTLEAELVLPVSELQLALKEPLNPKTLVEAKGDMLKKYLADHFTLRTAEGRAWTVTVTGLAVAADERPHEGKSDHHHDTEPFNLVVTLTLTPPECAELRKFQLEDTVIHHEVMSHRTRIFVEGKGEGGEKSRRQLDLIRSFETTVEVDLNAQG